MRASIAICLLVLTCRISQGQEASLKYRIPGDSFRQATASETAAITSAICDGTVKGGRCDTCPNSESADDVGFSVNTIVFGHFVTPESTDAMATVGGCEQIHGSIGWGFLVTKREGEWTKLEEMLGLTLDHCHAIRFRTGRQLLVCEDFHEQEFELMHGLEAVFVKDESLQFRSLLVATDTTLQCFEQPQPHKAQIDAVEFRDLNGDGIEDVAITASFGTLPDSSRRRQLCDAAAENPKLHAPAPKVMKSYRIEYLFDGRNFKATPASEAALKIFADTAH